MSLKKIENEFKELSKIHTMLELSVSKYELVIQGLLGFCTVVKGEKFVDEYAIKISFPKDYPKQLPKAFETSGRITNQPENHINPSGSLCVGTPPKIREILYPNYSLTDYINKVLIGYLSQYSYKEKYGKWPYGEMSHGVRGIIDYYKEEYPQYFDTDDKVIKAFKDLSTMKTRPKGYIKCNCGCKKLVKNCKYQKLLKKIRQKEEDYNLYIDEFNNMGEE